VKIKQPEERREEYFVASRFSDAVFDRLIPRQVELQKFTRKYFRKLSLVCTKTKAEPLPQLLWSKPRPTLVLG